MVTGLDAKLVIHCLTSDATAYQVLTAPEWPDSVTANMSECLLQQLNYQYGYAQLQPAVHSTFSIQYAAQKGMGFHPSLQYARHTWLSYTAMRVWEWQAWSCS